MNEFLQIITYIAQGSALWAILYYWKSIRHTTERYFLYYLIYVLLNEILAKILTYTAIGNYALYNIYDLITFTFLIFWFSRIIRQKKIILVLIALYISGLSLSLYLEDPLYTFLNIHVFTGTSIVLVLVVLYFATLLQQKQLVHFLKVPAFWISTGLLLFHIGYLPIQILLNYDGFDRTYIYAMLFILNIAMYSCFTKGFICSRQN